MRQPDRATESVTFPPVTSNTTTISITTMAKPAFFQHLIQLNLRILSTSYGLDLVLDNGSQGVGKEKTIPAFWTSRSVNKQVPTISWALQGQRPCLPPSFIPYARHCSSWWEHSDKHQRKISVLMRLMIQSHAVQQSSHQSGVTIYTFSSSVALVTHQGTIATWVKWLPQCIVQIQNIAITTKRSTRQYCSRIPFVVRSLESSTVPGT